MSKNPYLLRNKNQSQSDINNTDECELQKLINKAVSEATANFITALNQLEDKVEYLAKTNKELINTLRNNKCATCENIAVLDDSGPRKENVLDMSKSSDSSSDTVIAVEEQKLPAAAQETYAHKISNHSSQSNTYIPPKNKINNKRRNSVIVGTGDNGAAGELDDVSFGAPRRRLWLYVGRCKNSTTEGQVTSYLTSKNPEHTFEVTKLTSKGVNSSFRVSASYDLKETLYRPDFWPQGIVVKQFKFFRQDTGRQGDL